jgi:hypothetical protein
MKRGYKTYRLQTTGNFENALGLARGIRSLFRIAEKFDPLQSALEALKRANSLIEELASLWRGSWPVK